jgi:hypothetical protein
LIPSPIRRVLSSIREHRVKALLMGGQACVFYGAAEFSRDTDLAILADTGNLSRLGRALRDLDAVVIAVPPFRLGHLREGLAVHFRCGHPEALGMRIDVLSKMRGVASFPVLWRRRTVIELPDGLRVDLLSLPDLVRAKKTQRDKDWPMVRRLLERHFLANREDPNPQRVRFWLLELRTPELLCEACREHPAACRLLRTRRPLLDLARCGSSTGLVEALAAEERTVREEDRRYWAPLRAKLEQLRLAGRER